MEGKEVKGKGEVGRKTSVVRGQQEGCKKERVVEHTERRQSVVGEMEGEEEGLQW